MKKAGATQIVALGGIQVEDLQLIWVYFIFVQGIGALPYGLFTGKEADIILIWWETNS